MNLIHKLKPIHLRLMVRIVDTGKLQSAADAVAMSQPAASRILKEIERDAGGQLFHRTAHGMTPTDLGGAFLRHARVILTQLDSLGQEVQQMTSGALGHISVGSVTGPAVSSLIPAVEALKAASPGVQISVEIGPSAQLVRNLEEGQLDFILGRLPAGYGDNTLNLIPGRHESVELLVHESHPLAHATSMTLDDVRGYEWVMQDRGSPIREAVEQSFHSAGLKPPSNVTNSSSLLVALSMLRSGTVIAPQTEEVAGLLTDARIGSRLKILPLAADIIVPTYFVITESTRTLENSAQKLLDAVVKSL